MKPLLSRLARLALRLAGVAIILIAIASVAVRVALPHADGLRGQLAARIGEALGVDVQVGALTVRLRGLSPQLTLDNAELIDLATGDRLLGVRALGIDLDLPATLRAWQPRVDRVTLEGAEIAVERGADGRIGIRGLDAATGDDPGALDFFLREGHFRLTDSTLYWIDPRGPAIGLVVRQLDFDNRGQRHRIALRGRPPGERDGRVTVAASLEGPPGDPDRWSGEVYLDWHGVEPIRLLRRVLPRAVRLAAESVRVESWNRLDGGRLTDSTTEVAVDDLVLTRPRQPERRLRVGDLSALVEFQDDDRGGWHLAIADLSASALIGAGPTLDIGLWLRKGDGSGAPSQLLGAIGDIALQPLAEAARFAADDLPDALARVLAEPVDGQLQGAALRIDLPAAGASTEAIGDWRARGRIVGLDIARAAPLPGLRGIDLAVEAGSGGGTARLDGEDAVLDLRPAFVEPFTLTRLGADLAWRRLPAGSLELWSPEVVADTPDLHSRSRFRLCTHPSAVSPFIDLHAQVRDGDGAATGRYLPVAIMDPALVRWLKHAIIGGHLDSGDVLLRGRLADFPFDDRDGRFLIELKVSDGILDYTPPAPTSTAPPRGEPVLRSAETAPALTWPRLEDLATTLRFEGRRMDIDVAGGRMLGVTIDSGRVSLPNLWRPERLRIDARGQGPLGDGLRVLTETPLAPKLGGVGRALTATGSAGVELTLGVPLRPGLEFTYAGKLAFDGKPTVGLAGNAALRLTGVDGRLDFDNAGVRADDIRARLDGQPVTVDIDSGAGGGGDGSGRGGRTEVAFTGTTPVAELARRAPSPFWRLASGQLDWRVAALVPNDQPGDLDAPIDLALTSDLRGLGIDLPAPLGKEAGAARAFSVNGRFSDKGPLTAELRLGDIGALLELARTGEAVRLARATVDLSGLPEALPDRPGIRIDGRIERLDLAPWLAWAGGTGVALFTPPAGKPQADPLPVLPSRLAAGEVALGALRATGVDADFEPRAGGGWSIRYRATGGNVGGGEVTLPAAGTMAPVTVRLDSLDLKPLVATGSGKAAPKAAGGLGGDPRGIGRIALDIGALRFGEDVLGRLRASTEPVPGGVRVPEIGLAGALVDITGNARWTVDATDYATTEVQLSGKTGDLGAVLKQFGSNEMAGGAGTASLALTWPGGPADLTLARLRGSAGIDVGNGRLLAVNSGVGRLLGILNLGALRRRLSLDFSDVFDAGFGFDSMTGRVVIGGGSARISQFDILSSAADIRITGVTDLVNETFDQSVRVTPKLGTGVAIAGVVAGGPLVGAAVYLADKLAGGAVDRLGQQEYSITGTWKDPQIRRIGSTIGAAITGADSPAPTPVPTPATGSAVPSQRRGSPAPAAAGGGSGGSPFLENF